MGRFCKKYTSEVYVYYMDMPCSIDSSVVENPDGSFTIYLNSRMTYERNIEGCLHELKHLRKEDLAGTNNIHDIENEARKG